MLTPALLRELARVHWAEAATIRDRAQRDRVLDIAEDLEQRADAAQDLLDDDEPDLLELLHLG